LKLILGGNLYSKEQQLKKVKEKKVLTFGKKKSYLKKKSKKNLLTKEEQDYLTWLHNRENSVCFVCSKRRLFDDDLEWHHVKNSSSDKKNHFMLIPLCGHLHHRNGDLSPHGNAKRWRETFSLEVQLSYAAEIHLEYINSAT
jgi:hypothetical protein